MTIAESYKAAIQNAFKNVIFKCRTQSCVETTLRTKIYGSETLTIIPPIQVVEFEKVDDYHDKVTFTFDDYSFSGIITWRFSAKGFVFDGIE